MNQLRHNVRLRDALSELNQIAYLEELTEGQRALLESAITLLLRVRHWHDDHPPSVASVASKSNGQT